MAPNWMATVNIFTKSEPAMPITEEAIIICPVEEMGKNSVMPSIIARMTACRMSMRRSGFLVFLHDGEELDHKTDQHNNGCQCELAKIEDIRGARHQDKACDDHHNADDHQHVVLSSEHKIFLNFCRRFVGIFYLCFFSTHIFGAQYNSSIRDFKYLFVLQRLLSMLIAIPSKTRNANRTVKAFISYMLSMRSTQ